MTDRLEEEFPEWPLEAEREFWRDVCAPRRHPEWYWWFLRIPMGYEFYQRQPGNSHWLTERVHKPFVLWHQGFIDRFIDNRYKERKEQIKVADELPRGWGKTQCVSIPVPLAIFLEFPNLGWANGSENMDKSAELMLDPQRAILSGNDENAWFSWLYGLWLSPVASSSSTTERRPSRKYILTHNARTALSKQDQSLRCWGVRGGMTGKHPDGGVMDDPVSEEAIRDNENWLSLANRHMDSMFFAFATSCLVFFPHTRYRDNDPAGTRWEQEGICEWAGDPPPDDSIRVTKEGQWHVYYVDCYDERNHSKCPEIETTRALWQQETANPVTFAAQKRNQPGRGEHQLITTAQMRACLVHPDELPRSGTLYIQCKSNFEDLNELGVRESLVSVVLQDPRNNGVNYFLEGFGDQKLRIEDFCRLVCRLVVKTQQDVNWKRYRLAGITDSSEAKNKRGSWTDFLRQFAAGVGIWLPPITPLPRTKAQQEPRVVRAVGYALDKRYKLVDGASNTHNVVARLVRYYTERGSSKEDWAILAADSFDPLIYRPSLSPGATTQQPERRFRRVNSSLDTDRPVWDERRGIYDTGDLDYAY